MRILQTVSLVLGISLLGGAAGLGSGCAIGCLMPTYYRAMFPYAVSQEGDAIIIGMGLGITQGFVLGLGVSLFLLLLKSWRDQQERMLEEVHGLYVALERIRAELAKR